MRAYFEYPDDGKSFDDLILEADGHEIFSMHDFSKGSVEYPTFVIQPSTWVEYMLIKRLSDSGAATVKIPTRLIKEMR